MNLPLFVNVIVANHPVIESAIRRSICNNGIKGVQ